MRGLISLCLWGSKKIYCQGAIDNVKIAKSIYPDFDVRIYINPSCPALSSLSKLPCQLHIVNDWADFRFALTRFYAASDKSYSHVIFRDCDSILNDREAGAVREWVASGLNGHIIREVPEHLEFKIMAGLCGIRTNVFENMEKEIKYWLKANMIGTIMPVEVYTDQLYLNTVVWKKIKNSYMGHGYELKPFPPSTYKFDCGSIVHEEWRNLPFIQSEEN